MRIDAPDDLGKCSGSELEALRRDCEVLQVALIREQYERERRGIAASAADDWAKRPAWARKLHDSLEKRRTQRLDWKALTFATVVVLIFAGPSALSACHMAYARFEKAQKALQMQQQQHPSPPAPAFEGAP